MLLEIQPAGECLKGEGKTLDNAGEMGQTTHTHTLTHTCVYMDTHTHTLTHTCVYMDTHARTSGLHPVLSQSFGSDFQSMFTGCLPRERQEQRHKQQQQHKPHQRWRRGGGGGGGATQKKCVFPVFP